MRKERGTDVSLIMYTIIIIYFPLERELLMLSTTNQTTTTVTLRAGKRATKNE